MVRARGAVNIQGMRIAQGWDDVLDSLPAGWRLGPVRFFPHLDEWQACAETTDGRGCVVGTGPDSERAMADLLDRLANVPDLSEDP